MAVTGEEEVLVCRRDLLPELPLRGLVGDERRVQWLPSSLEFLSRKKAETDQKYKQIIPYSLLRYGKMLFRYRRSTSTSEERLHDLFSIGIGGHINRQDVSPLQTDLRVAIERAREREAKEEFEFSQQGQPILVGMLNDDTNDVGRVHLGIVYEYTLKSPNVQQKEKHSHVHCEFVAVSELIRQRREYETWSQIIIELYLSRDPL
jgi:predicted NUDIX family phosphoesterase